MKTERREKDTKFNVFDKQRKDLRLGYGTIAGRQTGTINVSIKKWRVRLSFPNALRATTDANKSMI